MKKKATFFVSEYAYGFSVKQKNSYTAKKGLNESIIREISHLKKEPAWMMKKRLQAYAYFLKQPIPMWGADLSGIDFTDLTYFIRSTDKQVQSWDDLPQGIKETYDRIGVPEAEKKFLAGVSAQFESEVVYKKVQETLHKQGVIFCDMDTALQKHEKIIKSYFGSLIPYADNTFAALNTCVWSGGSFVYVPRGVSVQLPLQAYFRMNAQAFGQFERTLIIAEEASYVHYIEGCTAPVYTKDSLHAAVVEIFVRKGARVRYTTVQNWSKNVYNLVTKRSRVEKNGLMEWVDCNLGSKVTMKYPAVYLMESGARGEVLSISFASADQHQDAGAKMIHFAPHTSSRIVSKSIAKDGGRTSYRGLVQIMPKAHTSTSFVSCDALLVDEKSRSDTYPMMRVRNKQTSVQHEASIERIGEEKIFYLMSRGLTKTDAETVYVNGFIEPITKEIPFEYTVELNRLIRLEMEGAVG